MDPLDQADNIVIFIHGVMGGAESTWLNKKTSSFWPELMRADIELPKTNVYVVEYDSPNLKRSLNVHEIAVQTSRKLQDEGIFKKHKNIFFVTHSMGGLIAKDILVDLRNNRSLTRSCGSRWCYLLRPPRVRIWPV